MESEAMSRFWRKLKYIIELAVTLSAAIIPVIVAGLVLVDREGRFLNYLYSFSTEAERNAVYIKVMIILIALVAAAIFSQRFLQLERIKISIAEMQDDLRSRKNSDSSISPYLATNINLDSYIQNTQTEIVLIGINLTSLLGTYRERINAQLLNGRRVTVAIIDPNEANLDAATRRSDVALSRADYYRTKIETSILELRQMAATAAKHGNRSNVKLLLIPYAPTFSIRAFDPRQSSGRIIVEIYPLRTADSPPMFLLKLQSDQRWFAYFREQMETILRDGCEYDLDDH